ncbi:MAG: hypothetical protein ACQXXJ_07145, partial [Candidatus Bathyarchaeia archaeon]
LTTSTFNAEQLKQLYRCAVEEPNLPASKSDLIKCPECGEEILMIPTVHVMNVAIENHVRRHKAQLKTDSVKRQQTALKIKLSLTLQVLQRACHLQKS